MPNLPGMGNPPDSAAQQSVLVGRVLQYCDLAVDGLTAEQLSDTRGGLTNSPGFDVWHVIRTIDNIIHFVFERETPVWLQHNFHEAWGLPKVDQGTGMNPAEAYGLRFPGPDEFNRYGSLVRDAVVPRIAAMSDAYLAEVMTIRPWGEVPRVEAIGHGLIGHGNGHLGRVSYARNLLGLPGLPY